jgi:23S rRNA pseudouridine1911/1915/1917 synthase
MEKLTPTVIFEDSDLLIINKPAGMVVNKAETAKNFFTLQEWVEERTDLQKFGNESEEEKVFQERSGIAHRLDKETSGIMLIAKNPPALVELMKQFKERVVEKTYEALVHGKVTPASGEINVPIGRLPWNRTHFGVLPAGRESRTLYKVLAYKEYSFEKKKEILTLLEAYPKTGRTHQIRVHLRFLGYPIFADSLYAGRKNIRKDRKVLSRHFLHAKEIRFLHPMTHKPMHFIAELPLDLLAFVQSLAPYKE